MDYSFEIRSENYCFYFISDLFWLFIIEMEICKMSYVIKIDFLILMEY